MKKSELRQIIREEITKLKEVSSKNQQLIQQYKEKLAKLKGNTPATKGIRAAIEDDIAKLQNEEFHPQSSHDGVRYKRNRYTITSDKGNIKVHYDNDVVGTGDFDNDANGFFVSFKSENKSGQHGFDEYSEIVDYAIKHNIKR